MNLRRHTDEFKAPVETTGGVLLAAVVTREATAARVDGANPAQRVLAGRATVDVPTADLAAGQREDVATALAGDAEVGASLPPLGAVRGDPAFFRTRVGDQMRKFVAERALGFAGKVPQARVEEYLRGGNPREACRARQTAVPADRHTGGEFRAASRPE